MIRKTQQLSRRARWRRRSWRLLEGNAGEGNGRVVLNLQVRYSIDFQWSSYLQMSRLLNMLFSIQNWHVSQRLGSCLSPSFLLCWPTQSSPLPSTTIGCRMMADFNRLFFFFLKIIHCADCVSGICRFIIVFLLFWIMWFVVCSNNPAQLRLLTYVNWTSYLHCTISELNVLFVVYHDIYYICNRAIVCVLCDSTMS